MVTPQAGSIRKQRAIAAQQSKVTNGTVLLRGVDQRNPWVRRAKDLIAVHVSDMGGEENMSGFEMSMLRRVTTLTMLCETMETKFAKTETADIPASDVDLYSRVCMTLRALVTTLGLQRRSRTVGKTLQEYIEEKSVDDGAAGNEDGAEGNEDGVVPADGNTSC